MRNTGPESVCERRTREKPAKRSFSNAAMRRGSAKFCRVTELSARRACGDGERGARRQWGPEGGGCSTTNQLVGRPNDALEVVIRCEEQPVLPLWLDCEQHNHPVSLLSPANRLGPPLRRRPTTDRRRRIRQRDEVVMQQKVRERDRGRQRLEDKGSLVLVAVNRGCASSPVRRADEETATHRWYSFAGIALMTVSHDP